MKKSKCPQDTGKQVRRKRQEVCKQKGHQLQIIRRADGEVGAVCSDYCKRCRHRFTRLEQETLRDGEGIYTETLHEEAMAGP